MDTVVQSLFISGRKTHHPTSAVTDTATASTHSPFSKKRINHDTKDPSRL
jgi:hypothetical protein